jgi:ADP-heptose:LPS heptosyltransferase
VYFVGNLGDIVVGIPTLVAIRERYPGARITLLTCRGAAHLPGAIDVLRGARFLDAIEEYPLADTRSISGLVKLIRTASRLEPDLFVMLPPVRSTVRALARDQIFARASGAPFVSGLQVDLLNVFLKDQARILGERPREVDRLLASVRELGISTADVRFELPPPEAEERERIAEQIATLGGPFAVVCPGGKQMGHLWPGDRFGAIAARLRSEAHLSIVTIGIEAERPACERTLAIAGGDLDVSGRSSVLGTAELLRYARLLVTNDTGPMHLAAAVGTPVVAIFSSNDLAGRWYPYGAGHEVLRAALVCDECLFAPVRTDHCVRRISVDEVWAGCARVLARSASQAPTLPR